MCLEPIRVVLLLAVLGAALAGCGTRSSLDNPASDADRTATADSGQGKREGDAPKPHRGFVLDGLIR